MALPALLATGCGGGPGRPAEQAATRRAAPAGIVYTSDQLEQALLPELVGYQRSGEPDSGEYGALKSVQSYDRIRGQVKLDKPRCADGAVGLVSAERTAPTATVSFGRGDAHTVTQVLMALPAATADRQVKLSVPAQCRRFRSQVGRQLSEHQVAEYPGGDIGLGSRTVGVATVTGAARVKTWYVVTRGQGYLSTVSLYGASATRAQAELLARRAYEQAERILP
ncbi:hypothetical protein DPM19_12195 [Actinomadura craniellae]|uniref:Sensor domain-containing protein n=1 Tax=Actinomadura craniellae TaxID=2231787 RepID=A0A365H6C1_9ACTN|nr:hypothetical protein DPM19_12195 [Actinomadura craniellae]